MKNQFIIIAASFLFSFALTAQKNERQRLNKPDRDFLTKQPNGLYAKIETNKGIMYVALEHKKAPMTVANFIGLAEGKIVNTFREKGEPFYDGLKFFRVIPNFMILSGCPRGTGTGDPGYKFNDEIDTSLKHNGPGVVGMVNTGKGDHTNGSQFYITHTEAPWLDDKYSVFGKVVQGVEVIHKILQGDSIRKLTILRKGKEFDSFDAARIFETESAKAVARSSTNSKSAEETRIAANLKAMQKFSKAHVTSSGLRYIIEKEGSGASPKANDQVTLFYRSTFTNGKEFDSNFGKQPATVGVDQVIPGWSEGLQLMKPGGRASFYIPYQMAYGEKGQGKGIIPPKSDLILEVELVKIN